MIFFDFKGINLSATVGTNSYSFKQANGRMLTRFDRIQKVHAEFWDFMILNDDFYEFAFIKSTLQLFIHSIPRRGGKDVGRITINKSLQQNKQHWGGETSLSFVARQKNNQNYLHIFTQKNNGPIAHEEYLDQQEVMMLDIALGKIISLLSPYEDMPR